jgi:hypothetical protein
VAKRGIVSILCTILCGLCCLPMLIFGGWLLALWITIQISNSVYLEYPYLKFGIVFLSLGAVAIFCLWFAARRRGFWSALFVIPVFAGLWTMVVIPNIIPYDTETGYRIRRMADELASFRSAHGGFPDQETALPPATLKARSPYYRKRQQLPFRVAFLPNATRPFLDNPGADPGVIFYAVSADHQEVWLTGTELRFPYTGGGSAHFVSYLSNDGDTRVLHLHAAPVSK